MTSKNNVRQMVEAMTGKISFQFDELTALRDYINGLSKDQHDVFSMATGLEVIELIDFINAVLPNDQENTSYVRDDSFCEYLEEANYFLDDVSDDDFDSKEDADDYREYLQDADAVAMAEYKPFTFSGVNFLYMA